MRVRPVYPAEAGGWGGGGRGPGQAAIQHGLCAGLHRGTHATHTVHVRSHDIPLIKNRRYLWFKDVQIKLLVVV